MPRIDYSKPAEICWVNRPYLDEPFGASTEEYFDEFTLREAVLFVNHQLDLGRCKSVTVTCNGRLYSIQEVEELFRSRDFPMDEPSRDEI